MIDELASIVKKMPRHVGTTWRGAALSQSTLDRYQIGEHLDWPAFSSTSLKRSVALGFARSMADKQGVLFKIHSKTCIDVRGASEKLWEEEILCLPGTRLRATERELPKRPEDPILVALEEI